MSYSTLSVASIGLALLGVAVAIAAAILVCFRRQQLASRALTPMLVLFLGGAAIAFVSSAEASHDLQHRTRRAVSLAVAAERVVHARSGRYTRSASTLRRLSPALRSELRNYNAKLNLTVSAVAGSVRVRASFGFGTIAERTLLARDPREATAHVAGSPLRGPPPRTPELGSAQGRRVPVRAAAAGA